MKKIVLVFFIVTSIGAKAQQTTDTAKKKLADTIKKDLFTAPDTVKHLHSKAWTLVPPIALIAYGASSFVIHPIRRLDYYIYGDFNKLYPSYGTKAESYFMFAPVAITYGLNLVGIEGKNRFVDRTALLGLSLGFFSASTFSLKYVTHRLRPNRANYYSFPSGHTGNAFVGAEFLAQEYSDKSPIYSVVGYSFAVATGVFRMYNRDHWFSDVVAGAGFGILSTKAAYLVYPYLRNALTHTDKKGRSSMIMPMYQDGTVGLSYAMQL